MPAIWTPREEAALVDFLVENKAEAGDGGNFKNVTFQRAALSIAPLHERGALKTVKSCQNKYAAVSLLISFLSYLDYRIAEQKIKFRKVYCIICAIQLVSGWAWDDGTGASITVDSASSWEDYVKKHPEAKPFWNKGWPHFQGCRTHALDSNRCQCLPSICIPGPV